MIDTFFIIELALLGLAIGSFLNVVIARLPLEQSIVKPRSRCPRCETPIAWYDNLPVVSWLVLGGKCRQCKLPISPRYILVELLTGALFLAAFARFGWTWNLVMALTLITVLVPLTFIDAEHWLLPFELTLPGIALGLLLRIPMGVEAFVTGLIGAGAAYLAFRIMEYVGWLFARREALGAGDKFLLAVIGAFLGWRALLGVVALSSLQGAIFGIAKLALTGRAGPVDEADAAKAADAEKKAASPSASAPQAPSADAHSGAPNEMPPGGEEEEEVFTFTPDAFKPGLSIGRRLLLLPWTFFLQPIPDEPEVAEGEPEPEWVPGDTNLPYGPWIALAGLELMLAGPWLVSKLGDGLGSSMVRTLLGS